MRLQAAVDDALQPQRPPLEPALLLERLLELALEVEDQTGVALAHPRGLLLHVGKVDAVQVAQHLTDVGPVLQHGPRRLRQVVEPSVPPQGLRQRLDRRHFDHS